MSKKKNQQQQVPQQPPKQEIVLEPHELTLDNARTEYSRVLSLMFKYQNALMQAGNVGADHLVKINEQAEEIEALKKLVPKKKKR